MSLYQHIRDTFLKKHKLKMFFYRNYWRFQGGHLKVWHYFNHLKNTNIYEPHIFFSKNSILDNDNPWQDTKKLPVWEPAKADALFLAGLDWQAVLGDEAYLKKRKKIPVINLIQHVNHANPSDIKYAFLKERAIRICVSNQVAEAIKATGQVNGPVFTIPNNLYLQELPKPLQYEQKDINLLIVAIKQPTFGLRVEQEFKEKVSHIVTITTLIPRSDFLNYLNRAKVSVFLPNFTEGFYLPALEGMALDTFVICPDCIGNRSFCIDGVTCLAPAYDLSTIFQSIYKALALTRAERDIFMQKANQKVKNASSDCESKLFIEIINNIKELW